LEFDIEVRLGNTEDQCCFSFKCQNEC